ncbi:hypothetical protein S7S_02515 [Isoalcanivorax pacificus W11-5]|uniref:Apea-like HEPN domain-containing protein n=1 Tax=Isoalcanivorax pacificus W11-5 TaxID=391936 RepID=A0A0B4XJS2_9GAMM|nr:HEPN domain-containing protein [Isoalcanivorax pacificus]AJD46925.1 hypothetical protein S7S_02515 [Isoalcanivorax pacificus W11-5]
MLTYTELKARHRGVRDTHHENLRVRVHRALSWLHRAEQAEDVDARFLFLWIAFNAAYAQELDERHRSSEQAMFRQFVKKLCGLDSEKQLEQLLWKDFSGPIRTLLDTPWVFRSFWECQRGELSESEWQARFTAGKHAANRALAKGNTATLLDIVLQRIYVLRNQIMHGGATWNGQVNRRQLEECTNLMGRLVPVIILLMMDNPRTLWGDPCFPVVTLLAAE